MLGFYLCRLAYYTKQLPHRVGDILLERHATTWRRPSEDRKSVLQLEMQGGLRVFSSRREG